MRLKWQIGGNVKETNFLQEGFRKPELEIPDPYYYVCGGRYTYEELEKMT